MWQAITSNGTTQIVIWKMKSTPNMLRLARYRTRDFSVQVWGNLGGWKINTPIRNRMSQAVRTQALILTRITNSTSRGSSSSETTWIMWAIWFVFLLILTVLWSLEASTSDYSLVRATCSTPSRRRSTVRKSLRCPYLMFPSFSTNIGKTRCMWWARVASKNSIWQLINGPSRASATSRCPSNGSSSRRRRMMYKLSRSRAK